MYAPEEASTLPHPQPGGSAPTTCRSPASGATCPGREPGPWAALPLNCHPGSRSPAQFLLPSSPLWLCTSARGGCHTQAPETAKKREVPKNSTCVKVSQHFIGLEREHVFFQNSPISFLTIPRLVLDLPVSFFSWIFQVLCPHPIWSFSKIFPG